MEILILLSISALIVYLLQMLFIGRSKIVVEKKEVETILLEQSEIHVSSRGKFYYSVVMPDHPYYQDHLLATAHGLSIKDELDAVGFVCEQTPWCDRTFGANNWIFHRGRFYFKKESDATMFLLRWS